MCQITNFKVFIYGYFIYCFNFYVTKKITAILLVNFKADNYVSGYLMPYQWFAIALIVKLQITQP